METPNSEWEHPDGLYDADGNEAGEERLSFEARRPGETDREGRGQTDLDSIALYLRDGHRHRRFRGSEVRRCRRAVPPDGANDPEGARPAPRKPFICEFGRQRMVERNLGLVVTIAKGYRNLGLPLGDLIQEGNLGLLHAARRFEPKAGRSFSAYAAGWIRQTICRALSQQSRTIRVPLRRLELRRHACEVEADEEQRCGNESCAGDRRPAHTTEHDARELGVSVEELRSTILLASDIESLDTPTDTNGHPRILSLPDPGSPDPCESAAGAEQTRRLRIALSHLPDRLRHLLEMRFGLAGGEESSLAEIGQDLHVSTERARQLQQQALDRLRRDPELRGPPV